ncbi:putative methyltransferase-like protein 7A [Dunckerocampus dactyliophorus]|uniref:putative methyltransferase-like protein 7A n=1 Tax=Dunckerocampus dactyliophorus TaxID=161453 RepID=UPI0024058910|nr:putative methyltransferase-like protein 7A [Dunckerocampus dactyliophorus]
MRSCLLNICRLLCVCLALPFRLLKALGLRATYKRCFPRLAYTMTFKYNAKMHSKKKELFRNVCTFADSHGTLRLLEIGCGGGANFQFYPYGCTVLCADPNPHYETFLQRSMRANKHLTYEAFLVVPAEDMKEVQDESVDVVVCTLVLCSVRDVKMVLQEVRRVLKTGGAFFFLEHVMSSTSAWTHFLQHTLEPLWFYIGDGCTVTRATWKDVESAGFSQVHIQHLEAPVTAVMRPHIMGYCIK